MLQDQIDLISAVAITPEGRYAVWGSDIGALRVWDLESGETAKMLQGHTDWVTAVAVTPDGQRAVSASADGTLRVWNLQSGQSVRMLQGHTGRVTSVAVTPDGHRAISASADGTLRVWNLQSGEYSAGFTAEGPISRFVIALDGRTIIANEKSGRGHFLRLDGVD
jgi:WD40 repeat protein